MVILSSKCQRSTKHPDTAPQQWVAKTWKNIEILAIKWLTAYFATCVFWFVSKKKKKEKNLVKLFSALLFFPQSNMNSNWQKYLDIHWPNFTMWQIKSNWWLPFYIFLHKPNKNITNMHCYFIGINFFRVIFLLYNVMPFLTIFLISNKIKY